MSCCPTIFIMTENSKIADRAELSEKLPKWAFSIYFFLSVFFLFLDFCFGDRKAYFTICTFSVFMAILLERPSHGAFALAQPKTRRGKLLPHCRIEQKTSLSQSQSTLAEDSHNNWPRRRWVREREGKVLCKRANKPRLGVPELPRQPSLSLSFSLPPEVVAFGRGEHWAERAEIREISITCCAQFICTLGLDRLAVLLQEWPRRGERGEGGLR